MKNRVEIEIDGEKLKVEPDKSVLEVALDAGRQIPHFCYHKKLSITASCRMCLVEVEGCPRPQPSCATPVTPGMVVHTHSHVVTEAQKAVLEFLLINHPLDCPVCDKGGECRLQDLSMGYGSGVSRYNEEKRVVFTRDVGPLISMQEMNRCIHCTRCIRFGEEVAGIQELGMINRSDHAEITAVAGKILVSELSGNMIDLCPVGAITSRPFRFSARSWELSRHRSISPHDSLGSNLIVQTLNDQVMRVLPLENESINECWISDRDRFSYEGLNSEDRLKSPMIKQNNTWIETDWQTALDYITHGLKDICSQDGDDAVAGLTSTQATLEEMYLLKKLVNGLGSTNVDFRQRETDFSLDGKIVPWLGMPIQEIDQLDSAFIVGSFLRKDHPVISARIRRAAGKGTIINCLHGYDDDWLMPVKNKIILAPSQWLSALSEVMMAVAAEKGIRVPRGFGKITFSDDAKAIASVLMQKGKHAIFLGNTLVQHHSFSQLHAIAEWIARETGAVLGHLGEGANAVGGNLVRTLPPFSSAEKTQAKCHQAYVLLHAEPELDAANPLYARTTLLKAKMVVVMSSFKHGMDYADVMLPVSPFTETSGTYINCEGCPQDFRGVVEPLGDTRPAWKVLRVLGNLLDMDDFSYNSSEEVYDAFIRELGTGIRDKLNNYAGVVPVFSQEKIPELERITDVPVCFSDPIVRRASALQKTHDAQANQVLLPVSLCEKMEIMKNDLVTIHQGKGSVLLHAIPDPGLPDTVLLIHAGHSSTAMLGSFFGPVEVRKA